MKYVGVMCNVDELGRVVIPKEIRDYFKMIDGVDRFEFFTENDTIILRKFDALNHEGGIGIARPIDKQGRVVIPRGIRKTLGIIDDLDALEIYVRDSDIILKKHQTNCVFCSRPSDFTFKNQAVCKECLDELTTEYTKQKQA